MTRTEALALLKPPLRFGDPEQIQAVEWLAAVEKCREFLRESESEKEKCEHCKGTGSIRCYACGEERDCNECDGESVISTVQKKALKIWARDIVEAALEAT